MSKLSNREKILAAGLQVVHARGFNGASVRDIVQAAGVPQGSFTNHFTSKEAFGLEILDHYFASRRPFVEETLQNAALRPLQRIAAYVAAVKARLGRDNMRNGCLYGNFIAESGDVSDTIRQRVAQALGQTEASVAQCLREAVAAGDLRPDFECADIAGFVVSSLQGAILLSKAQQNAAPLDRFERILFQTILR
ncbi:TetR/AcrR family transcriptional regulator [Methylovirgula sp. 4M-Z18]|uniref:TetR/AcrR family transcriptional regulator n=1 Tax=Methylovirgula sp. 4M-Z18 TaxID=2293567 RepID=UPI000E2F3B2E|nr:TetR/AcrR family transcriptional regulator [Methylovirgula sp. 4M-Z18]RFB75002.1 TetR family transcriptional regulator [Methylovirgula sp. 4M-Z18]